MSFLVFLSCTREAKEFSTITIKAPSSKLGTFAALPGGRVACYTVSVKGSGISGSPASTCKPAAGTVFSFAAEGASIQGQVTRGTERSIDVYLYLQAVGENIPCSSLNFHTLRSDRLYLIGSVSGLNFSKDVETVDIPTTFPGESQSLYTVNSYPVSCLPTSGGVSNYQISSSFGTATGSGYILQGRVGRPTAGGTLTGSGIILKLRE